MILHRLLLVMAGTFLAGRAMDAAYVPNWLCVLAVIPAVWIALPYVYRDWWT